MSLLDRLAREGTRRMLTVALEAEVEQYINAGADERDDSGQRLVVRNGYGRSRSLTCGAGIVEIRPPRVDDRRVDDEGEFRRFKSRILPPYVRRSAKVAEVLPILYLRALSTGNFRPALESLLGKDTAGLLPTTVAHMTERWEAEYAAFRTRSLSDRDYLYVWAAGVHLDDDGEGGRLCTLVLVGARSDCEKELIVLEEGFRESAESWRRILQDLKRRGLSAPMIAIGDGGLGFWVAAREVWPSTTEQRDWGHKLSDVLEELPRQLHPQAMQMLRRAMYAPTRTAAVAALSGFTIDFGAQYPKAVDCVRRDENALLAFFDFPAEHWKQLRTANAVESPSSMRGLRQRVNEGAGSRSKGEHR